MTNIPGKFKNYIEEYIDFSKPIEILDKQLSSIPSEYSDMGNFGFNCLTVPKLINVLYKGLSKDIDIQDLSNWSMAFLSGEYFELEEQYFDLIHDALVFLNFAIPKKLFDEMSNKDSYFLTDELIQQQIDKLKNIQPEDVSKSEDFGL